jgi:cell division protein FtsN
MAGRRGKPQARRGNAAKYGLVLAVGLLLGLGLAAAYLIFGEREPLDALLPRPDPAATAPAAPRDAAPEPPETPPAPRFDFYTLLPERQVELPGVAETEAPAAAPIRPPSADAVDAAAAVGTAMPGATGGLLQAGAFRNAADAEAMRAQLALLGRVARVETVEVEGRPLHRVRLGPFADVAEREQVRQALAEAGITATPAR